MKKIPTLFKRDPEDMKRVTAEVHPDCQWVLDGEGVATRKVDGTCVMYDGTLWWGRREVKPGKPTPDRFQPVEHDETTGKTVGWQPIEDTPFYKAFREAARLTEVDVETGDAPVINWKPGTYELIGPKVNGNPERSPVHQLVSHDDTERIKPFSLTYEGLRDTVLVLADQEGYEGIVWHHPDGRMAKLKARDFPRETRVIPPGSGDTPPQA